MPDLAIREALPGDEEALWGILEPVVREGATFPLEPDTSREEVFAYWFAPDKRVFVAERGGELLGTFYVKPNSTGPGAHVANSGYMVRPDARGLGIGEAMTRESFVRAKALGYLAMQYNLVVASNEGALDLYRRLGMEEIGRLPRAFRHPQLGLVDAVVMYRLL